MDQLLCARCKKNKIAQGQKRCDDCLLKQRQYMRERRSKLEKQNLCDECKKNERRSGGVYCLDCLDRHKQERIVLKNNGLCIMCGQKCETEKARCNKCIEYAKTLSLKQRSVRKKSGLCIKCGNNVVESPHVKCESCLSSQAQSWHKLSQERRSRGECINCCQQVIIGNRFCEICYLKTIAGKRTGLAKNWVLLKNLFQQQGGICPYTGRILEIGKNAELDHIVPRDLGGTDDISNLQWVFDKANNMKWNYLEEDFLNVVKEIYEYRFSKPNLAR